MSTVGERVRTQKSTVRYVHKCTHTHTHSFDSHSLSLFLFPSLSFSLISLSHTCGYSAATNQNHNKKKITHDMTTTPKFVAFILSIAYCIVCLFQNAHTHTHSPENTMKLQQTHRHTQTFSLHNSSSFNLWQEIDGGKYQISCVRGQSCTPTPHLFFFLGSIFFFFFLIPPPKQSITCFQPMAHFQANLRKTISFRSGNGFTLSEKAPLLTFIIFSSVLCISAVI